MRNSPKLILRGHHHPDIKTRHRCHKERKLQANITDEHRCKNPQQILASMGRSETVAWTYIHYQMQNKIAIEKQPHSTGRSAWCFVSN